MNKLPLIFACTSLFSLPLQSAEFITKDLNRDKNKQSTWLVLPYVFSSESMGFTTGAVALLDGYIQPQMSMVLTTFVGQEKQIENQLTSGSEYARAAGGMYAITGYRPEFSERLFISSIGAYGYYPNQRLYIDGSNDSIKDIDNDNPNDITPLISQGYNNWFNINLRYVLPWGESAQQVLPTINLQRGIPVNREGVGGGQPFATGQTIVGSEIFYSRWSAEALAEEPELNSNGLRFFLEHDNTDFPSNPSRGYAFTTTASFDFGWANSTQSWNALDFDYKHYIALPQTPWMRQSVLALNSWLAYSPSWDNSETLNDGGLLHKHQTPMWEGARLGGWSRLRAYDSNRFNDKAAIYGAVEYRFIPRVNPMADQAWNPFPIDWFQIVLFAEAGRVAENFNKELLQDLKFDAGFSVRALAAKIPVRFEAAWGEEGSAMWVMLNQPF